ncbi:MerR family transcriptional regulator [Nocardia sp. NPDC005978]|uniref:MerR family transcriptional regulator n=1 Tax=Nocardia sp. NPDC005978 TaxID=3156725 RepID=UPI0033A21122
MPKPNTCERWESTGPMHPLPDDELTVGAVAARLGVTVRALHHWDAIGLVCPSERSEAGYRLYTAADVARAHRVLIYRELGVPLTDIGPMLDTPGSDALGVLRRQRDQIRERVAELESTGAALDRLIRARESGPLLSAAEQREIFGPEWEPDHVARAGQRWGETAQWAQYAERAADRTPDQWRAVAAALDELHAALAAACRAGATPGSPEADALAERHRASMAVYFDCSHAMQVCLGRTYAEEPGYRAFYDGLAPGLAGWLRAIIDANAGAHGVDPDTATWD